MSLNIATLAIDFQARLLPSLRYFTLSRNFSATSWRLTFRSSTLICQNVFLCGHVVLPSFLIRNRRHDALRRFAKFMLATTVRERNLDKYLPRDARHPDARVLSFVVPRLFFD
jgi:hypothetical protein